MCARSASDRFIMKITALVFLLWSNMQTLVMPEMNLKICMCVCARAHVPNISAEDPEGSGVEQQSWDEEQQVEVGVHCLHVFVIAGQIVATGRGDLGHILGHRHFQCQCFSIQGHGSATRSYGQSFISSHGT